MWYDNIGFELNIGDYVLCLAGNYAYTIQQINRLSQRDEGALIRYTVVLGNKSTLSTYNVISLATLNLNAKNLSTEHSGQYGYDVFGNGINVGDKVLFLHRMEMYTEIGTVTKLSPKTCVFNITKNRFDQTSYKKPYSEIISLTALGLDESIINRENRN